MFPPRSFLHLPPRPHLLLPRPLLVPALYMLSAQAAMSGSTSVTEQLVLLHQLGLEQLKAELRAGWDCDLILEPWKQQQQPTATQSLVTPLRSVAPFSSSSPSSSVSSFVSSSSSSTPASARSLSSLSPSLASSSSSFSSSSPLLPLPLFLPSHLLFLCVCSPSMSRFHETLPPSLCRPPCSALSWCWSATYAGIKCVDCCDCSRDSSAWQG